MSEENEGQQVKPFLRFPPPTSGGRESLTPALPRRPKRPSAARQSERLSPQFQELRAAIENKRMDMATSLGGAEPEMVAVFELAGSIDGFYRAVRNVPGLEWLAEFDDEPAEPDNDFSMPDAEEDGVPQSLYVVMQSKQGLEQLISLFNLWSRDPATEFARGLGPLKQLFAQVRKVRLWDARDRTLSTTVMEYWADMLSAGQQRVRFEAELWYFSSPEKREAASRQLRSLIESAGGQVVATSLIEPIRYHAALLELPSNQVKTVLESATDLLNLPPGSFVHAEPVMMYQPMAMCTIDAAEGDAPESSSQVSTAPADFASRPPTVALLDGVPLENHHELTGWLNVDDPDDFTSKAPASRRQHGTAMSSLILTGDLGNPQPRPTSPLYVRPLLVADTAPGSVAERVPADTLAVDLTYRAIRRIFEGEGSIGAVAPTILLLNFSIGDPYRQFIREISAWGRLLDWASWAYKCLFFVSCGNHPSMPATRAVAEMRTQPQRDRVVDALRTIFHNRHQRRLLSPSEAINVITVGAAHDDATDAMASGYSFDVASKGSPSPVNAVGDGFRRAIKPDILMPGGRQFFTAISYSGRTELEATRGGLLPPGLKVAVPGGLGSPNALGYIRGTSAATAMATGTAERVRERLVRWWGSVSSDELSRDHLACLVKALMVHAASWQSWSEIEELLRPDQTTIHLRDIKTKLGGHGYVDLIRLEGCSDQRATLLGFGTLRAEQGREFTFPLPQSLSGQVTERRLSITLAWLTPVTYTNRKYRGFKLWYEPPAEQLRLSRGQSDWRAVRRGTVQHEILYGERAVVISPGDTALIKVNCIADGLGSRTTEVVDIPFALGVTLETAAALPIYTEVRDAIRPAVPVVPRPT